MSKQQPTLREINLQTELNPYTFIEQCEHDYSMSVCRVADSICRRSGHMIVMLAGPSSSGKTTTASMLVDKIRRRGRDAATVSLDDFYLDQDETPLFEDGTPDFETVNALDLPLIEKCLRALDEDGECELPVFSFINKHRDKNGRYVKIDRDDIVIVEGLHALNPAITDALPESDLLKLYISVSTRIYDQSGVLFTKRDLRLIRRLIRDFKHRDSSAEKTFELWRGVRRGEDRYLFPFACNADIRINTLHPYEPCVFKAEATRLLKTLLGDERYCDKARELLTIIGKFNTLDEKSVPETSLLTEFVC